MIEKVKLNDILFLDIETVPQYSSYSEMPENLQQLWNKKAERLQPYGQEPLSAEDLYHRAGIYAEFGKIVCISVGIVVNQHEIRLKSFWGEDEYELLIQFASLIETRFNGPDHYLCAHNGKEFDFPYLCRRMLINGIRIPSLLNMAGKKPWEITHLDTMELWKFGDYKNYTSLELLAAVFDIPTPKDDIDGSEVHRVYWQEKDLPRIVMYCQKDVVTIIQLFRRYLGMELIPEERIIAPDPTQDS
ncbi:MAG: 3'-5' exonuclease [Bacteroidales bacterium]